MGCLGEVGFFGGRGVIVRVGGVGGVVGGVGGVRSWRCHGGEGIEGGDVVFEGCDAAEEFVGVGSQGALIIHDARVEG